MAEPSGFSLRTRVRTAYDALRGQARSVAALPTPPAPGRPTARPRTHAWTQVARAMAGMGFGENGMTLHPRLATALGWKVELTAEDYYQKYQRQELAQRIIDIYPDYTWRLPPRVTDDANASPITPFEAAYEALSRQHNLPMVWRTLDILMGLGHFAVLLLGVDDGAPLSQPLRRARQLTYVTPYSEVWAQIEAYNGDETSERYLRPEQYRIEVGRGQTGLATTRSRLASLSTQVHWSRCVHVAENSFDGGIVGTPRLRSLYNVLDDVMLLYGSATLMFYRAGIGRYVAAVRDTAEVKTPEDVTQLREEFDEFIADQRQFMHVEGYDVTLLESSLTSPKDQIDAHLQLIASGAGIPQRILYGSERGELASTQDQTDWETTITSRQQNVMTPLFIRQTIDRLIALGILPTPNGGDYQVAWPPTGSTNPIRQAEIAERLAKAIAAYVSGRGRMVVPVEEFRERALGLAAVPVGGLPDPEEFEQGPAPVAAEEEDDGG